MCAGDVAKHCRSCVPFIQLSLEPIQFGECSVEVIRIEHHREARLSPSILRDIERLGAPAPNATTRRSTVGLIGDRPKITLLERTKIQAEVLVPLIKAMEAEMGREQAHGLVRRALGGRIRESISEATSHGGSRETIEWALRISKAGDVQDHQRLEAAADEINLDVTRCAYAEFFDQLNEPELGFLLVCSLDYDIADGAGVTLERSQTIMQGGNHCDFRFRGLAPPHDAARVMSAVRP